MFSDEMAELEGVASFHSISFPSEWGVENLRWEGGIFAKVSIQLVSPASGE